jgi:predicted pyridoxine 5'-phosphate oxidase superfamily flavin-nucleotide-binding protein/GNAT superfamily N-acetyltransferase
MLTDTIRTFLRNQRLAFVATISDDGSPNLSPKGSTRVLDERRLVFADIRSPQTVHNLRERPAAEVAVVDVRTRVGYRFKGRGTVLQAGADFQLAQSALRNEGVTEPFDTVVIVDVERVSNITSPVYDRGTHSRQVEVHWQQYWVSLWNGTSACNHWSKGKCFISTDKALLDVRAIHDFLSRESYWARGIPLRLVERSLATSLCFGLFTEMRRQIGFARVVTDYATFAYLADVYVLEQYRKQGLGEWLMTVITEHPDLQQLRRWMLATRDAHALYGKVGFKPLDNPGLFMARSDLESYQQGLDPSD